MKAKSFQDLKVQIFLPRLALIFYQNYSYLYVFLKPHGARNNIHVDLCGYNNTMLKTIYFFFFQTFIISQPMKTQQYLCKVCSARNSSFCFKREFKAHQKIIHHKKIIAISLGGTFFVCGVLIIREWLACILCLDQHLKSVR